MDVLHVITGLGNGGAEQSLFKFCVNDLEDRHFVVSLDSEGRYGPLFREAGVGVVALGLRGAGIFRGLLALRRVLASQSPDVVHAWMPHATLLSSLAAKSLGVRRIHWGVRASDYGTGLGSLRTRLTVAALALL
jgi:hypothetical protein